MEKQGQSGVLVFGASSTWGAWDDEKHGWVTRFQLSMEKGEYYKYEVYNLGISGNISKDVLERMEPGCKAILAGEEAKKWFLKKENILIIEIGKNDSAIVRKTKRNRVSQDDFKSNLSKILKIARKYADNVAFMGCTSPINEDETTPWDEFLSYTNKDTKKYSNIIKEFCGNNDILFIDVSTALGKSKKVLFDGLHLNSKGHQIVADTVEKELIKSEFIKL